MHALDLPHTNMLSTRKAWFKAFPSACRLFEQVIVGALNEFEHFLQLPRQKDRAGPDHFEAASGIHLMQ